MNDMPEARGAGPPKTPQVIEEFAAEFREKDNEALLRSVEPRPPSGNHNMSAWGHSCARFQWYNLRKFREREPLGVRAAGQFWMGNSLEEPAFILELEEFPGIEAMKRAKAWLEQLLEKGKAG